MRLTAHYSTLALHDVNECSEYFEARSDSVADRFQEAVRKTVRMLCENPELGERLRSDPEGQIRYRTVSGFTNYVIFFRRRENTLEIVRVLHGAMDYEIFFD